MSIKKLINHYFRLNSIINSMTFLNNLHYLLTDIDNYMIIINPVITRYMSLTILFMCTILVFKTYKLVTDMNRMQYELCYQEDEKQKEEQEPDEPQEQEEFKEQDIEPIKRHHEYYAKVIKLKDVKEFLTKIRVTKLKHILPSLRQRVMIPGLYTKYDFEKLLETSMTDADWNKLLLDFPDINQFVVQWFNNRNSKTSIDTDSDEPVAKRPKKVVRTKIVLSDFSDEEQFKAKHQMANKRTNRKIVLSDESS